MIILIGGAGSVGKTRLAQTILERYRITYLSADHLKMGLYRGWEDCGFTPLSSDSLIADSLWPVIRGIVETNIENGQRLTVEGCYLPQRKVTALLKRYPHEIRAVYLILSEGYVRRHFQDGILAYRNVIESRGYAEERTVEQLVDENTEQKRLCLESDLPYLEIQEDYERELDAVFTLLGLAEG